MPSAAARASGSGGSVAKMGSGTIDLSKGWGSAKACLVWHQGGVFECFPSEQQLQAREDQLRPSGGTAPPGGSSSHPLSGPCSSSLDLYSGATYTGWHLVLWDQGYWQHLADYGFDKLTVSFIGGACSFHLAQGPWGGGYWYPGYTGPYGASPNMGWYWDYTISSVYIV